MIYLNRKLVLLKKSLPSANTFKVSIKNPKGARADLGVHSV